MKILFVSLVVRKVNYMLNKKANIIFYAIVFVACLLIASTSQSQETGYFTTVGTDPNDNIFTQVITDDSIAICQYLSFGYSIDTTFELHLSADYTPITPNEEDTFDTTFNAPTPLGACLPEDVIYNPVNNKYYVSGGWQIIVIDGTTHEVVDTIKVSKTSDINRHKYFNLMPRKVLAIDSDENILFYITHDSEIVAINCSDNSILGIYKDVSIQNDLFRKLYFQPQTNKIYWLIYDFEIISKIIKLSFNTNTNQFVVENEYQSAFVIFDFACNRDGDSIFIGDGNYFKICQASDFSFLHSYLVGYHSLMYYNQIDHKVYFDRINENYLYVYDINDDDELETIETHNNTVGNIGFNQSNNTLVLSTYARDDEDNITEYGIEVINCSTGVSSDYQEMSRPVLGSIYNTNYDQVYVGSKEIIKIPTFLDINTGGRMNYQMGFNTINDNIIASNINAGSSAIIDENDILSKVVLHGGGIEQGLYNPNNNKVYYLQYLVHPFNQPDESLPAFLLSIDCETNTTDTTYIYCEPRSFALDLIENKIFISEDRYNQVLIFDCDQNEIIGNIPISPSNQVGGIFSPAGGKIYLSTFNKIYIFESSSYTNVGEIGIEGWISDMSYDFINHQIFASNKTSNKVLAIDEESNSLNATINVVYSPFSLSFNQNENLIFCSHSSDNYKKITAIDASSYIAKTIDIPVKPRKIIYNENNDILYILEDDDIHFVENLGFGYTYAGFEPLFGNTKQFLLNRFNNCLYFYTILDNRDVVVNVLDCNTGELCKLVPLHFSVACSGPVLTTRSPKNLVLNTKSNKLYCGNLGFSTISVIQCAPETRTLNSDITWLSFPRLDREGNNGVDAQDLLDNNLTPFPNDYLEISHLLQPDEEETYLEYNSFGGGWLEGDLDEIISDRGYILEFSNSDPRTITCEGTMLNADHQINLYGPNKYNWVGYFLPETQDVFDAIPQSVLDNLSVIAAQNWACVKYYFNAMDGNLDSCWMCSARKPLRYGDMLKLKPYSNTTMQWQRFGVAQVNGSIPKSSYFTYQEEPDYTPIYIEMDSTDMPSEIAAFVGDSCIGATVVGLSDTLVMVRAYTNDTTGQEIVFETWYDSLKSAPARIHDYWLFNKHTLKKEKRAIHTGEKKDYYLVSFTGKENDEEATIPLSNITINSVRPNPFSDITEINYTVAECGMVRISILTLEGQRIQNLFSGNQCDGTFSVNWDGTANTGKQVENGVYMLCIETEKETVIEKLVYIK